MDACYFLLLVIHCDGRQLTLHLPSDCFALEQLLFGAIIVMHYVTGRISSAVFDFCGFV